MSATSNGILLIDDDALVITSAKRLLLKKGFNVWCAESGSSAIKIYSENLHHIGLVLLDLSMPDMDSEEIFDNLLSINKESRVVLFSGNLRTDESERLFHKGAVGSLRKPFDMYELTDLLDRWLPTHDID